MGYVIFLVAILIFQQIFANYYYKNALKGVKVKRYFTKNRLFEGDTLEVVYEIENHKRLPLFNLMVIDYLPDNLKTISGNKYRNLNSFHITIWGYKKVIRRYKMVAAARDYVSVSSIHLRIHDVFGILESEQEFKSYDNIYIYPRPKQLKLRAESETIKEARSVKKWIEEDPLSFYSVRKYTSTDPFKKINWKKTAQLGELMVNEYEANKSKKVSIYVNLKGSNFNFLGINAAHLEDLLRYTAYLARYFVEHGYELSVFANSGIKTDERRYVRVEPGMGRKHLNVIYEMFSLVDYHMVHDDDMIIRQNRHILSDGKVIVVSMPQVGWGENVVKTLKRYGIDALFIGVSADEKAQFV
ncbi:Uncharacterized conserved protein, DUF58 family, contains vWF domain [Caldanaerobius fijiensis DSM 17918]|uniref:Uncharacterized conserved protein, DUF58 family, contains vWF domain n=1 Tax=Caldanaerobius fijiensis DSM 17918 TaxID=1121256 RepID=A0A1M5C2E9_9THEO|nr:DUF58 domain-containing protein [Caldanaerobius fijiensis]SHF48836.1 Uncharacterized conserved protein, DUF58 family, contains vWF domain [Caldanaerobius fijiensis DSM 17918]